MILQARLQPKPKLVHLSGIRSAKRITKKVCISVRALLYSQLTTQTVERRRREVINEGIENIAKVVPGNEKNKGAILQRTAHYIQDLQDQIGKFDTERQTFDVTIKELSKRIDLSREALKQTLADANKWQQRCRDAGLSFDDYDGSGHDFDSLGTADLDAIGA